MLYETCKGLSIVLGLKVIRCLSCNKESTVNYAYTANICDDCSNRKGHCVYRRCVINKQKILPFTPEEAIAHPNNIPDKMILVINELLSKKLSKINSICKITQDEIINRFIAKLYLMESQQITKLRHKAILKSSWLDFKEWYEAQGCEVERHVSSSETDESSVYFIFKKA